jgi:MFS family permease
MLVPLYIAEMAPPSIRGRLVGVYEIGVQLGTLIGFWINYGVHQNMAPNSTQWIFPFAFQLIPGGLLTLGMFFVPESPRWTARTKGRDETVKILTQLRNIPEDHSYLQEEASAIVAQIEYERAQVAGKGLVVEFKELCRRENRRQIITGILIFVFMQMAGSNAINVRASLPPLVSSTDKISTIHREYSSPLASRARIRVLFRPECTASYVLSQSALPCTSLSTDLDAQSSS